MAIELDYRPPDSRSRRSTAHALSWMLLVAILLNWPSLYVYLFEQARLAANPQAYPFEAMGRQPPIVRLWWYSGAVARVPLLIASLIFFGSSPTLQAGWRTTMTVAVILGAFAFEFLVSFYNWGFW